MHLPIWTAPVYVYPISMHFGTFQLELIGVCYPLHILHLSPALYRLTEVALIILTLPTNSTVRRLVQGHAMLLHLRLSLLMHGLFSITFFFYFALSRCHFFIAWTGMYSGNIFYYHQDVPFSSSGNMSTFFHSIGDGWTSPVSLNSEQIHQRFNFSNVCKDGNLDT